MNPASTKPIVRCGIPENSAASGLGGESRDEHDIVVAKAVLDLEIASSSIGVQSDMIYVQLRLLKSIRSSACRSFTPQDRASCCAAGVWGRRHVGDVDHWRDAGFQVQLLEAAAPSRIEPWGAFFPCRTWLLP